MKRLDRYITRLYATNIAALFAVIVVFVITIDVSFNMDRFWKRAAEVAGADASAARRGLVAVFLIWDLWWPRLLQLFNYLNGLVLVGAMGFTLRSLVRHRELCAMISGGWSVFRVARPILIVAGVMLAVQVVNQELIVPGVAGDVVRDHGDAGKRALDATAVPLARDSAGRLFHARAFVPDPGGANRGTLDGVYIIERDDSGAAVRRVVADSARWRDGGWDLANGRTLPASGTPPQDVRRIETDLDPLGLKIERYKGFSQNLGWVQIGRLVERMKGDAGAERSKRNRDRLERLRWARVAGVVANLSTLCIALSFFLRRDPSELTGQALKAAPVTLAALVGGAIGSTAAIPGVPPQMSVFIPAVVLVMAACALVFRVKS
ncbi:MAG: LptF/LptG family permease [Phycisphaerales bacterium]